MKDDRSPPAEYPEIPETAPGAQTPDPAPPVESAGRRLLRLSLPPLAILGGLGALELARRRFQQGRVFLPSRPAIEAPERPTLDGLNCEDLYFPSEDGTRLHGWWLPHEGARMVLVYCHGNRGNIAERVDIYRQMNRLGLHVFTFDYRGYGRSDGAPSEKGLFADVRAALDLLAGRGIPYERMILFGHSMGGAVAIDGALHRPVGGLVVQSSFTLLKDMARFRYPDIPVHWITSNEFRSIEKVPHLRMLKLFIHGTADDTIPFSQGQALYRAAAPPKSFFFVANANHNDVHLKGSLRYFHRLVRFRRSVEAQVLGDPEPRDD